MQRIVPQFDGKHVSIILVLLWESAQLRCELLILIVVVLAFVCQGKDFDTFFQEGRQNNNWRDHNEVLTALNIIFQVFRDDFANLITLPKWKKLYLRLFSQCDLSKCLDRDMKVHMEKCTNIAKASLFYPKSFPEMVIRIQWMLQSKTPIRCSFLDGKNMVLATGSLLTNIEPTRGPLQRFAPAHTESSRNSSLSQFDPRTFHGGQNPDEMFIKTVANKISGTSYQCDPQGLTNASTGRCASSDSMLRVAKALKLESEAILKRQEKAKGRDYNAVMIDILKLLCQQQFTCTANHVYWISNEKHLWIEKPPRRHLKFGREQYWECLRQMRGAVWVTTLFDDIQQSASKRMPNILDKFYHNSPHML